jgi:hypothetical protein
MLQKTTVPFKIGEGNPNGRPTGSRNRRNQVTFALLREKGDLDSAVYLSSVVTNVNNPHKLRVQVANSLMPYMYSKAGPLPAPRFIHDPLGVPQFQHVEDAEVFLSELPCRVDLGEIDIQFALDISLLVRNWIEAKRYGTDLEIKVANNGNGREQTIHISGGLPNLTGANILMPLIDGRTIDSVPVSSSVAPTTESIPADPVGANASPAPTNPIPAAPSPDPQTSG